MQTKGQEIELKKIKKKWGKIEQKKLVKTTSKYNSLG